MNALVLAVTLLASTPPSTSQTRWMTPEAFRLTIGMKRSAALSELKRSGWSYKKGKLLDEVIVPYAEGKTVTLKFARSRLQSVRFELVGFIPEIRKAFTERTVALDRQFGRGRKLTRSVISYETRSLNVMLVESTGIDTSYGKQGLGFLVTRYFEPPPA